MFMKYLSDLVAIYLRCSQVQTGCWGMNSGYLSPPLPK